MRTSLVLAATTLLLGFACFEHGGVTPREWGFCMAGLVACALPLWWGGEASAPRLHPVLAAALIAAPAWVGAQLIPLPLAWLRTIDPSRAELVDALNALPPAPIHNAFARAPLSVAPALTYAHLERLVGYLLMFFIARELTSRLRDHAWRVTVPILIVATFEALLGAAQFSAGAGRASGTYVNPNHYAALLQTAFPFAVMFTAAIARELLRGSTPRGVLRGCLWLLVAAAIAMGSLFSLSRMAPATLLLSGAVIAILGLLPSARGRGRLARLAIPVAIAMVVVVLAVTPSGLVDRLAGTHGDDISNDLRTHFRSETVSLISAYPLFGCGLGTFGSAIQKFRHSAPLGLLQYAHNDYLQVLAETGVVGFIPFFAAAAWLFCVPWRAAFRGLRTRHRMLAAACAASLSAIALNELVDFNFYVPANMLAASWIAGIGSALNSSPGRMEAQSLQRPG